LRDVFSRSREWLRAFGHATMVLGLALIALLWTVVEYDLWREYQRAETAALRSTNNLARVFEDQIVRVIKAGDSIIRPLQIASANGRLLDEFRLWSEHLEKSDGISLQISLSDATGSLIAASAGPLLKPISIADREHFQVHREGAVGGLFISKPVRSRLSDASSVLLTRAYIDTRGEFGGVIVVSITTKRLSALYESVDLGPDGGILLVGLDGVVRASAGFKIDAVGKANAGRQLLQRAANAPEGSFVTNGALDGVRRLTSYRVLDAYPLAITVGLAKVHVFADYRRNKFVYRAIASVLTAIMLVGIGLLARHKRRLAEARESLRASEAKAREKSEELELTLDHMNQGIMMVDANSNVALMNRQLVKLLGLPERFLSGRPKFDDIVAYQRDSGEFSTSGAVVDPRVLINISRDAKPHKDAGSDIAVYERVRPNGIALEVRTIALPNGGVLRTFTDITERKRNADKIAHMAHHDALTGLANRVLLRDRMEGELARQRRGGEGFALLLIDLDRFKYVNDTLGHSSGDVLLRQVAERLQACVRDVDVVARLGGDEFAVMQSGASDRSAIATLARRIVDALSAPYTVEGMPATIGASIGIACSIDTPDMEHLFHNADLALYRVKSEGRNGFRLFEAEMDEAAKERRQLEADLRLARDRGEFEIHYQPIVGLADGIPTGVEALLRWNHPVRGRLTPGDFMALAEEIGVMPSIDNWVIEAACREAARWPCGTTIAINLSPEKFQRGDIVSVVRTALEISSLAPHRLELEISERVLLQEEQSNLAKLRRLREIGVRLALDDFGVGHSSLSDLCAFRFDKIKIDRSFVSGMKDREDCAAIVAAIAGLGRSMGAATTAEGVETEEQAALVYAAGCTEAQGFLYSYPLTASAVAAYLRDARGDQQAVA
jgi:diguanylate cyclase (GGDEF)-like protein